MEHDPTEYYDTSEITLAIDLCRSCRRPMTLPDYETCVTCAACWELVCWHCGAARFEAPTLHAVCGPCALKTLSLERWLSVGLARRVLSYGPLCFATNAKTLPRTS